MRFLVILIVVIVVEESIEFFEIGCNTHRRTGCLERSAQFSGFDEFTHHFALSSEWDPAGEAALKHVGWCSLFSLQTCVAHPAAVAKLACNV